MKMVGLWFVLFVISIFFLQPSLELLGLSQMVEISYHCCYRCSLMDNQIHYHRFYYTVILLPQIIHITATKIYNRYS